MLTRKMQRRAGPPFAGASFKAMNGYIEALLRDKISGEFRLGDQRWFSGGASKIQMGFTLHWNEPGVGPTATRLVARMEPAESLNSTSRLREFELLEAFAGVIPVPRVYWVDPEGTWFPEPALVYAFAEGTTKPKSVQGKVAGIGTNYGPSCGSGSRRTSSSTSPGSTPSTSAGMPSARSIGRRSARRRAPCGSSTAPGASGKRTAARSCR